MGTQELKGLITVIIMFLVELWKKKTLKRTMEAY